MANDANNARKSKSDDAQADLEARAKKEIEKRVKRGDIDEETGNMPSAISIEGHYVNVVVGGASFQFDANAEFKSFEDEEKEAIEQEDESDLEKASKAAKKKGK